MREIITLSLGNYSNYVNTHFWNVNLELSKNNELGFDNSVLYNDYYQPRSLIFDNSSNFCPHFFNTDYYDKDDKDDIFNNNNNTDNYYENKDYENSNEFKESSEKDKEHMEKLSKVIEKLDFPIKKFNNELERNTFLKLISNKLDPETEKKLFSLTNEDFYNEINLENEIEKWSDYMQSILSTKSLNEIKTIDLLETEYDSYLHGMDFFTDNKGFRSYYLDKFEDNFRKQLEDSDLLDKVFITLDFNSIWGGINSALLNEFICNEIPKTRKIITAIDDNCQFESKITQENGGNSTSQINIGKIINYLFFYSDIFETQETIEIMPLNFSEDDSFFNRLYNKKNKTCLDEGLKTGQINYFKSSLAGLDMVNMTLPYRESNYTIKNDFLQGLVLNNRINFIHSDMCFNLANEYRYPLYLENEVVSGENNNNNNSNGNNKNKYKVNYNDNTIKMANNGFFFTYNKNVKKDLPINMFNWEKHFTYLSKYKSTNKVVLHGNDTKLLFFNFPYNKFLEKLSYFTYLRDDKISLPYCFPRYINNNFTKNTFSFIDDSSMLSVYSHDYFYCNNILSHIPQYLNKNNFQVEKYIKKVDYSKYLEVSDRVESMHSMFDDYEAFKKEEEEEDELDY